MRKQSREAYSAASEVASDNSHHKSGPVGGRGPGRLYQHSRDFDFKEMSNRKFGVVGWRRRSQTGRLLLGIKGNSEGMLMGDNPKLKYQEGMQKFGRSPLQYGKR